MRDLLAPLAIIILAAYFRLYRLATVPFGWHPDEATKALLARDVLAGEYFPAFFSAFTGREALFVYIEALLFQLIGEGIFAGRLLSTLVGILTVALTFAIGRQWFNRRIGLIAAAFLSVSLWHLIASRNGYRAVIQPLIQLSVLLLLYRGLRSPSGGAAKVYFLSGGVFLGLTQYTYTAVRFFPFFIFAIVALIWLFDRHLFYQHLSNLVLMAVVAFLIFLPLGIYFWQHPDDFIGRAAQISVFSPQWAGGDAGARLWQSVKETARMWTVWGDINYRFNIAGQPVFDALTGLLFFLGLLLSVYYAAVKRGLKRVIYLSLLLWLGIMLLPMILSAESLPYYQRAIGTLPAVFLFPAITLDFALSGIARTDNKRLTRAAGAALLLFFLWLGVRVYRDYFQTWHNAERNDDDRRVAMVYAADYLQQQPPAANLYLSTQYVQHPTLALLAPQLYDGIHWFDARQSLPLPEPDREATYLLLAENEPQPWLLEQVPNLERVQTAEDRFGRPVFDVYRWQKGEDYPLPQETIEVGWSWVTSFEPGDPQGLINPIALPVNFGDVMRLTGFSRNAVEIEKGGTLELILFWQLLQKPSRQYTIFAHLLAPDGRVVSGFDANEYPTSFWQEEGGERLLSYMRLGLPNNLPAGEYQMEIGVYNQPSGQRLMISNGDQEVADRLLLEPLIVR